MEAMKDMIKTMVTDIVKARLTAIFMTINHLYCCCYTVNERVTISEISDLVNLPIYRSMKLSFSTSHLSSQILP